MAPNYNSGCVCCLAFIAIITHLLANAKLCRGDGHGFIVVQMPFNAHTCFQWCSAFKIKRQLVVGHDYQRLLATLPSAKAKYNPKHCQPNTYSGKQAPI